MFAQRYDPAASRKRARSGSASSSSSSSESESESETETVQQQESQNADPQIDDDDDDVQMKDAIAHSENQTQDSKLNENESGDDNDSDSDSENSTSISDSESDNDSDSSDSSQHSISNKDAKFSTIYQRLKASITKPSADDIDNDNGLSDAESITQNNEDATDLGPIPQPALPRDKRLRQLAPSQSLNWIAEPVYYSTTTTKPFSEYDFLKESTATNKQLLNNLSSNGYNNAFAVQCAVFQELILKNPHFGKIHPDNNNGDLLVNAATGSGKTLAYLIPILLDLSQRRVPKLSCVILVPTRPLVSQVLGAVSALSKNLNVNVVASNSNLSIKKELIKFANFKPDVLITTPGRLVDYLVYGEGDDNDIASSNSNSVPRLSLRYLKYLVIDEVDRLLNQSFQNWISIINRKLQQHQSQPNNKLNSLGYSVQKLLFSATLHNDVNKLASLNFYRPKLLVVDDKSLSAPSDNASINGQSLYKIPPNLHEFEMFLHKDQAPLKPLMLLKLLLTKPKYHQNTLIFTQSNESTLRLTKLLTLLMAKFANFYPELLPKKQQLNIAYLNSTLSSNQRRTVLNKFQSQDIDILIATDLVARGIDILSIERVINYDLPRSAAEYVHRVGRCARANKHGDAVTLLCGNGERKWFNKISREIGRSQPVVGIWKTENGEVEDGEQVVTELEKQFYSEALAELEAAVRGF